MILKAFGRAPVNFVNDEEATDNWMEDSQYSTRIKMKVAQLAKMDFAPTGRQAKHREAVDPAVVDKLAPEQAAGARGGRSPFVDRTRSLSFREFAQDDAVAGAGGAGGAKASAADDREDDADSQERTASGCRKSRGHIFDTESERTEDMEERPDGLSSPQPEHVSRRTSGNQTQVTRRTTGDSKTADAQEKECSAEMAAKKGSSKVLVAAETLKAFLVAR